MKSALSRVGLDTTTELIPDERCGRAAPSHRCAARPHPVRRHRFECARCDDARHRRRWARCSSKSVRSCAGSGCPDAGGRWPTTASPFRLPGRSRSVSDAVRRINSGDSTRIRSSAKCFFWQAVAWESSRRHLRPATRPARARVRGHGTSESRFGPVSPRDSLCASAQGLIRCDARHHWQTE